jgi:ornithine cyclodeaminase/alanine dehydrogenase-like protein (mu-crystallin family)
MASKAVEIGAFCNAPVAYDAGGIRFCDMTGLGSEDLAIARYCHQKLCGSA